MPATAPSAAACRRPGPDVWMTSWLSTDLERFWPSRRGHAFDEFCR